MVAKNKCPVIALDGPAASGKSTLGFMLAESLGYLFLDTGCMYRAVTLAALKQGVDVNDESRVTQLAQEINIVINPPAGETDGRMYTVFLDGVDVTWELRSPPVDAHVSLVSSYLGVRIEMVEQQRQIGKQGCVVIVGRDIGTVVMPDASLKLYITASARERARRRWEDRQKQGHQNDYDAILADVISRDKIDSTREYAPLRPADDALQIDTTDKTPEMILKEILSMVHDGEPTPGLPV